MKLLIITQKVDINDPILGFFHRWIIEFAKHIELLTVICLEEGKHDLPDNVRVLSLGKEKGVSKIKYIYRFYTYIFKYRKDYDSVFVHMNQIYVVLGFWLWFLLRKKIALWYVHRQKTVSLQIAYKLADVVFTSAKESFYRIEGKIQYVGHGIDFKELNIINNNNQFCNILTVGRITEIKDLKTLIKALDHIRSQGLECKLEIVGAAVTKQDVIYKKEIEKLSDDLGLSEHVAFAGHKSYDEVVKKYESSDLLVNLCPTGGMDKVVLEALGAGLPVVVANHVFKDVLGEYSDLLMFEHGNHIDCAKKINNVLQIPQKETMAQNLQKKVRDKFSVKILIEKIIYTYETGR